MFYQVNSYKIFLVLLGVTLLAIRNAPIWPKTSDDAPPWRTWAILSIPLLATVPGILLHQGAFNYNLRYELATNLILILWVGYLYRAAKQEKDLHLLLVFIGVTVIYAGLWSIFEKAGLNPWVDRQEEFVKSTFGHRNYYSGFLILLVPLLLVFSIPEDIFTQPSLKKMQLNFTKSNLFYCAALIFGGISLILAQTRAALAGLLVALVLIFVLYSKAFTRGIWRKRVKIFILVMVCLGVSGGIILYTVSDRLEGSRFAALFTIQAWQGRLLPWQTAITSIKESPLFGFGLGSSYNLFFSFVDPAARLFHFERSYNHVHSEILEYLQESGLFGLAMYLCFWGYIVYQLVAVLRDPSSSNTIKKLAIGISGGFLAYHIHSIFSVAPRMMVMKLPLFTLFAMVFLFKKLNQSPPAPSESPTILKKTIMGVPTFIILGVIWLIYLPWMAGQYQFVEIKTERPSLLKVEKLEKLVKIFPDIYALDYLSHLQMRYHRTSELASTVDRISAIIPHYREVGYTQTVLQVMKKDLQKAKEAGLEAQQYDRYHQPTIRILMGIALETSDYGLFFEQFQLFLRSLVFRHQLTTSRTENAVKILKGEMNQLLVVSTEKPYLEFKWDEKLIKQFYTIGVANRKNRSFITKSRDQYWAFLMHEMSREPYFKVKFTEQTSKSETEKIQETIQSYFLAKRELSIKQRQLTMSYQQQLKKVVPTNRLSLGRLHTANLENANRRYQERIQPLELQLKEKTDWDTFLKKQAFITEFSQQLVGVLFTGTGK